MPATPSSRGSRGSIASRYLESISGGGGGSGKNDVSALSMSSVESPHKTSPETQRYRGRYSSSKKSSQNLNDSTCGGMTAPTALLDASASWTTMDTRRSRSDIASRSGAAATGSSLSHRIRSAGAACTRPQTYCRGEGDVDCSSIESSSSHRRNKGPAHLSLDAEDSFLQDTLEGVGKTIRSTNIPSPASVMQQFRECQSDHLKGRRSPRKSRSPGKSRSPYPRTSPRTPNSYRGNRTPSRSRRQSPENHHRSGSLNSPYHMTRTTGSIQTNRGTQSREGTPSPARHILTARQRWQSAPSEDDDDDMVLSEAGAPTEIMTNRTMDVLTRNPPQQLAMPPSLKRNAWLPPPTNLVMDHANDFYPEKKTQMQSLIDETSTYDDSSVPTDEEGPPHTRPPLTSGQLRPSLLDAQSSSLSAGSNGTAELDAFLESEGAKLKDEMGPLDLHVEKTSPDRSGLLDLQNASGSWNTANTSLKAEVGGTRMENYLEHLSKEAGSKIIKNGRSQSGLEERLSAAAPVRYFMPGDSETLDKETMTTRNATDKSLNSPQVRYFMPEDLEKEAATDTTKQPRTPELVSSEEMTSSLSTTDALLAGSIHGRTKSFVRYNERNAPNVDEVFQRRSPAESSDSSSLSEPKNDYHGQGIAGERFGSSKSPIQPLFSLDRLNLSQDSQSPIRRMGKHPQGRIDEPLAPTPRHASAQSMYSHTEPPTMKDQGRNPTAREQTHRQESVNPGFLPVAISSSLDTADTNDRNDPSWSEHPALGRIAAMSSTSTGLDEELVNIMERKEQSQSSSLIQHKGYSVQSSRTSGHPARTEQISVASQAKRVRAPSPYASRWRQRYSAMRSRELRKHFEEEEKKDDDNNSTGFKSNNSPEDVFSGIDDDTASVKSLREKFEQNETLGSQTAPDDRVDDDNASVRSLRKQLEQRILAHEYLNDDPYEDGEGSVKSLREVFEPVQKRGTGRKVSHLRSLFETPKPAQGLSGHTYSKWRAPKATQASREMSTPMHTPDASMAIHSLHDENKVETSPGRPDFIQVPSEPLEESLAHHESQQRHNISTNRWETRHTQDNSYIEMTASQSSAGNDGVMRGAKEVVGTIQQREDSMNTATIEKNVQMQPQGKDDGDNDDDVTTASQSSRVKGPAHSPFLAMRERLLHFSKGPMEPIGRKGLPQSSSNTPKRAPPSMQERLNKWATRHQTVKDSPGVANRFPKAIEAERNAVSTSASNDMSSVTLDKDRGHEKPALQVDTSKTEAAPPSFFSRTNGAARNTPTSASQQSKGVSKSRNSDMSRLLDARKKGSGTSLAKPPGAHWIQDKKDTAHLQRNDSKGKSTDTEYSDGVTLDASIAEVSNLTDPSAIPITHSSEHIEGVLGNYNMSPQVLTAKEGLNANAKHPGDGIDAIVTSEGEANQKEHIVVPTSPEEETVKGEDKSAGILPTKEGDHKGPGKQAVDWPTNDGRNWTKPDERQIESVNSNDNFESSLDPTLTKNLLRPEPSTPHSHRLTNQIAGNNPADNVASKTSQARIQYGPVNSAVQQDGNASQKAPEVTISATPQVPSTLDKDYDAIMGSRHQMLLTRQREFRRRKAAREKRVTRQQQQANPKPQSPAEPPGSRMSDVGDATRNSSSVVGDATRSSSSDVVQPSRGFFGRTHPRRLQQYSQNEKKTTYGLELEPNDYGPKRVKSPARKPLISGVSSSPAQKAMNPTPGQLRSMSAEAKAPASSMFTRLSQSIGLTKVDSSQSRHEALISRLKSVKAARLKRAAMYRSHTARDSRDDTNRADDALTEEGPAISYRMRHIQQQEAPVKNPVVTRGVAATRRNFFNDF